MNKLIQEELDNFEIELKNFLNNKVNGFLEDFLFSKSKRLRPLLGKLFLKAFNITPSNNHKKLFLAVEILHNASLLHDDVIDNAKERRNKESINFKYDNSLAVSGGDLLLALATDLITDLEKEVQKLFSKNILGICHGEIEQYFQKFKIPTLEQYLEKTESKTSLLFEISILGAIMISRKNDKFDIASQFSKYFGIAFQIKNDLYNYESGKEDYTQGIYTAPVIYGEENGIEKTKILINNYLDKCENIINNNISDNEYTRAIIELLNSMRE